MVIGCGWTVLLKRDNVVCFWINGWNVCFWYVLFWRLYTVLPCIYELKCFIERCSDVLVNQKMGQKKWGRLYGNGFQCSLFFCLKDCNHRIITVSMAINTPQHLLYKNCNTVDHYTLLLCSLPFKHLLWNFRTLFNFSHMYK